MNEYVATFYTHLAAMRTWKALGAQGVKARMEPVPRSLSASCGVCVRYEADDPCEACLHRDFECVYVSGDGGYAEVKRNDAAV